MPTRQELVLSFMLALVENSDTVVSNTGLVRELAENLADEYLRSL